MNLFAEERLLLFSLRCNTELAAENALKKISRFMWCLSAPLGATRLIQLETLNYSQAAFIGRVSVAPFSRDEHGNTQCLFYSLLGDLPGSLLMLIDRSVVYYNINRMLYMAIKTKYKRSYRETLTGPT